MTAWPDSAGLDLLALWAEPGRAHAAWLDPATLAITRASVAAPGGRFPALSPRHPAAAWFERAIADLWGLEAEGGTDGRPWLDHGLWPVRAPMSGAAARHSPRQEWPAFLPVAGEGLHEVPVGPIHAGVIEPGHFRFTVQGEVVVRLEARLGYTHKGILALMQGKSPRAAMRFAARLSGDATVAHSLAFARAAEAASGAAPPPRAEAIRRAMLELERLHNHLNDLGFIANDAAFGALHAEAGRLREGLLRAQAAAFGHRLMMDRVTPGGVAQDLAEDGVAALRGALAAVRAGLPRLGAMLDSHASLLDRLHGTGSIPPALVAAYAPGGVVGRASGRRFDARLLDGPMALPTQTAGDVEARWRQRHAEAGQSLGLLDALLHALPEGPLATPLPPRGGEGLALAESFRGECLAWLRLDEGGLVEAAFLRDPSWLHWPLLEAAVIGNILADFPLINKSINGSYSGVDL
ncbi:nickel-dependent hydrogenase large subunit [Roseococcus sp. DSY-14]|uniref:hydrogenase large subunit n=1 Tax=Roseococcus sp. DSY-14 TaxID=3369650 RepID=UPI00387B0689